MRMMVISVMNAIPKDQKQELVSADIATVIRSSIEVCREGACPLPLSYINPALIKGWDFLFIKDSRVGGKAGSRWRVARSQK